MCCLAKSREQRPANGREVLDVLIAIELPEAQRWTRVQAEAWWEANLPPADKCRLLSLRPAA